MSEGYEMYISIYFYLRGISNRIYHIPFEKTTELHLACCKRQYRNADS